MDKQPKVAIAFERVVVIRLKLVSLQMDKQPSPKNTPSVGSCDSLKIRLRMIKTKRIANHDRSKDL
jgi:hypothetical protein